MTRELKFRAWDNDLKQMVSDNAYIEMDGSGLVAIYDEEDSDWITDISNYTIMQYTGLKDKLGKEIYEGDIIAEMIDDGLYHDSPLLYIVVFGKYESNIGFGDNNSCHDYTQVYIGWHIKPIKKLFSDGETNSFTSGEDFKIIGNIYENQELA
jgi:uncharacterized phage protein (TIGR01671 family)